jgi:hypothetical protein
LPYPIDFTGAIDVSPPAPPPLGGTPTVAQTPEAWALVYGRDYARRQVLVVAHGWFVTDSEAVAYVRQKIAERDQRMRLRAERDGTPLPAWVGAD